MKMHESLARGLVEAGAHTLFGLPGDANLYLIDAYVRREGARFVGAANEAGATLMAIGFAQASRQCGFATVTHGPAFTNTLTALAEGARSRTPMVLIAGDTAIEDWENLQNIDQRELAVGAGAGFVQMRTAASANADLATAVRRALTESRPIVLNAPYDFQWDEVEHQQLSPWLPPDSGGASPSSLEDAAGLLIGARTPIILAGRGAMDARDALLALADRLGAPVATTLRGRELFRGSDLDLGLFGGLASPDALDAIAASDCILAFGASLNRWTTEGGALLRGKRVVRVDTDAAQFALRGEADVSILGDAARVAEQLSALLDLAEVPRRTRRGTASAVPSVRGTEPVRPYGLAAVLEVIEDAMPAERTVITDAGRFLWQSFRRIRVPEPAAYVHGTGFGSIGLGMGLAIGAAVARADRPALLLCGDGGFMLGGITELNSAVRAGLDLVVVVLNDGAYGAEHIQLQNRGMPTTTSLVAWPSLAGVAEALGASALIVRGQDDLPALAQRLQHPAGVLLVDVRLDADDIEI